MNSLYAIIDVRRYTLASTSARCRLRSFLPLPLAVQSILEFASGNYYRLTRCNPRRFLGAFAHLTSPIAVEMLGILAANVPPNPQHVSVPFISMSSRSRTAPQAACAAAF